MVLVDDHLGEEGRNQQAGVDRIVSSFAKPGEFVDTGCNIGINEGGRSRPRAMLLSAFGMLVPTKDASGAPIVYTLRALPVEESLHRGIFFSYMNYVIAVLPEAPTAVEPRGQSPKE